jgi:hypothetical protein
VLSIEVSEGIAMLALVSQSLDGCICLLFHQTFLLVVQIYVTCYTAVCEGIRAEFTATSGFGEVGESFPEYGVRCTLADSTRCRLLEYCVSQHCWSMYGDSS